MSEETFDPAEHFNEKLSSVYDTAIREILPGYEAMHAVAQYLLISSLPAEARLLIAGVGTGHEAVAHAQARPDWEIVGVDPSARMLERAQQKVAPLPCCERITLLHGIVEDVPRHPPFDAVSSILVMQFLPDNVEKERYLREIAARMRAGGQLILIDLEGAKHSAEYNRFLTAWKAHQLATRTDPEQVERQFIHVDRHLQTVPEDRLRQLLAGAGFHAIFKFYKSLLLGGYVATKE